MDPTGSKIYYSNFAKKIFKKICFSSHGSIPLERKQRSKYERNSSASFSQLPFGITCKEELCSLKDISLRYIACNIKLADSFVGLPEIVGKEIFDACCKFGSLNPSSLEDWATVLNIFCEAYQHLILETLNLSGRHSFVNIDFEAILSFTHLKVLDLSHCKIGDNHPILVHLHSFHHLEYLSLSGNNFGVAGVKLLTQHNRRTRSGFRNLKFLKLNDNSAIRANVLPHIYTISHLNCILLDKTDSLLTALNSKVSFFGQCRHSLNFHGNLDFIVEKNILGRGWAIPILEKTISSLENQLSKKVSSNAERIKQSKGFYNKKPEPKKTFWSAHSAQNHLQDCGNAAVMRNLCMLVCRKSKTPADTVAAKRPSSLTESDENRGILLQYYMPSSKKKCDYDVSKFME